MFLAFAAVYLLWVLLNTILGKFVYRPWILYMMPSALLRIKASANAHIRTRESEGRWGRAGADSPPH